MPSLEDVTYSEEATVAAFRDYYNFLVKMYLKESEIMEPPEGGWPDITPERFRGFGKTDKVISLMRHLPYMRQYNRDSQTQTQVAPLSYFTNWAEVASSLIRGHRKDEDLKSIGEGFEYEDDIPSHVFGFVDAIREEEPPLFFIDTELGVVHWPDCPDEIKYSTGTTISGDSSDFGPANESEWRREHAWAIPDFFKLLKHQFRKLVFFPTGWLKVFGCHYGYSGDDVVGPDGLIVSMRAVYREHGWPNLEQYRKEECLKAVKRIVKDRFDNFADEAWRDDDYEDKDDDATMAED
jgi:hypothetical protein